MKSFEEFKEKNNKLVKEIRNYVNSREFEINCAAAAISAKKFNPTGIFKSEIMGDGNIILLIDCNKSMLVNTMIETANEIGWKDMLAFIGSSHMFHEEFEQTREKIQYTSKEELDVLNELSKKSKEDLEKIKNEL